MDINGERGEKEKEKGTRRRDTSKKSPEARVEEQAETDHVHF